MKHAIRLKQCLMLSIVLSLGCFGMTMPVGHAATTIVQKKAALAPYHVRHYRLVNNANYFQKQPHYSSSPGYEANVYQTHGNVINSYVNRSDTQAVFKTLYYLPVTYHTSGDLANPQSLALVGQFAYVMYTLHGGSNTGFVVKYDLNKMQALGLTQANQMGNFRQATHDLATGNLTTIDNLYLSCMQIGPKFNTGHGQSLAYNPKTKQMWFVVQNSNWARVQTLDQSTLTPGLQIRFRLSPNVHMGENLTFDKAGHAYFMSYSSGSHWAPKNTVKIYTGLISTHGVRFHLVMNGIKHAPGTINQSLGYDPKDNRLYLVSDDAIMTIPVSHLNHLTRQDVLTTTFASRREFEALTFDDNGNGYLMCNRGPEIYRLIGSLQ